MTETVPIEGGAMQARVSSILGRLAVVLVGLGLMATAPAAMAQILTFMFIDGIPGEVTLEDKRNWIELTGYSQSFGTHFRTVHRPARFT